jgi:hypothetical protein
MHRNRDRCFPIAPDAPVPPPRAGGVVVKAGARILVCGGVSRGLVGVVVGLSPHSFDGPCWRIRLDAEPRREAHIRANYLCPEPERSDEDVLGPLRNNVSG